MNNRFRILEKIVNDYQYDVCFMVDYDNVYIQAITLRTVWVKPLGYEVNIDETKDIIKALINDLVNPKATYFGTYEEAKARIELEIKLPLAVSKGRKRVAKLQTKTPLLLNKGKGEDEEEIEEEESKEKEVPLKKMERL